MGRRRKPRLLIAEDDRDLASAMRDALEDDFTVETVADGREAVAIAGKRRPDVVMADINMPSMNGYQVCQALRDAQDTARVPIIMVTGRSDEASARQAFAAGASDFMTKPFSLAQL